METTRSSHTQAAHIRNQVVLRAPHSLPIKANTLVWIGASASPTLALILELSPDRVVYRQFPYSHTQRISCNRVIFEDSAWRGCQTKLDSLREALRYGRDPFYVQQIAELEATMRGEGPEVDPVGMERCRVVVRYIGKTDHLRNREPWYVAEEYGGVGGLVVDGETLYAIDTGIQTMRKLVKSDDWVVLGFANDTMES